jgi:hypothetical protein
MMVSHRRYSRQPSRLRGSAELHDGGSAGLKRDPAGPFGTPTCATEKRKSEWLCPKKAHRYQALPRHCQEGMCPSPASPEGAAGALRVRSAAKERYFVQAVGCQNDRGSRFT